MGVVIIKDQVAEKAVIEWGIAVIEAKVIDMVKIRIKKIRVVSAIGSAVNCSIHGLIPANTAK